MHSKFPTRFSLTCGVVLTTVALFGLSARHASVALAGAQAAGDSTPGDVTALYKQATQAYQKLTSYQHTETYTAQIKTPDGQERKQSMTFTLAMERPNKFVFKSSNAKGDAAVSDGKDFINFRAQTGEYMKTTAPATIKGINLVEDVMFQPQATYLVALALQGDMLADKDMAGVISKGKIGLMAEEDGKKYQTVVIAAGDEATLTLYFDADTHLLNKTVQKVTSQNFTMTEQFSDIQINKPVDASLFAYAPPANAKLVTKFTNPQEQQEAEMKAIAAKYEGKPATDFTVRDRSGKEVKLSSFKDKIVVVDFWASWCGPCKMVMPTIQEIHDKYAGKGVVVMAVDTWDEKGDCEEFLQHNAKYTMPVLLDPAGKDTENSIASKLYGVRGIPTTLFIDRKGIVRTYAIGAHPRDFYIDALKKMGVQTAMK